MASILGDLRRDFHQELLGSILRIDGKGHATNADSDNDLSVRVAALLASKVGAVAGEDREKGQSSGVKFEAICARFLRSALEKLRHVRPGEWFVGTASELQITGIGGYAQYKHLLYLAEATKKDAELAAALGRDYEVAPDLVVARAPLPDEFINANGEAFVDDAVAEYTALRAANSQSRLLHAVVSCKWTMRSDRAQNSRTEALNLLRNRKGRAPGIVVITGEPVASRIGSLALGTGDIDCTYHFALPELIASYEELARSAKKFQQALDSLKAMVQGQRLMDISDLPLDLVS